MRFYHIHKIDPGIGYDNLWQVGKEIKTVDINPFWNVAVNYSANRGGKIITEYQYLLRELSLEIIREREHVNYPSRKRCIWLIRPEENQLLFWVKELGAGPSNYKIFEVEIDKESGKLFKGRNGFLPNLEDCFNNMIESAKKYWNYDQNKQLFDDEYLYEGKLKIIREIP